MERVFAYPCKGFITISFITISFITISFITSIILKQDYAINNQLTKKDIVMSIETIKQLGNGTWVVVLENSRIFSGMNKQDVIDFANEWMERQ